jgi:hypothetical protein
VILNHDPRAPWRLSETTGIPLAYLSIGEAEVGRWYWSEVRGRTFVIEPNPAWPDNVRVDIRDKRWQSILLDTEVPRLLAQGYRGFMLDTLDTAPYLEHRDPIRFAGSRQALVQFLSLLRKQCPSAILLANGSETLVDAAPFVDGYVTEGIFATYDLQPPRNRATTPAEREWRLAQVSAALATRASTRLLDRVRRRCGRAARPRGVGGRRVAPPRLPPVRYEAQPRSPAAVAVLDGVGGYYMDAARCASRSLKYGGTVSHGFGSVSLVR